MLKVFSIYSTTLQSTFYQHTTQTKKQKTKKQKTKKQKTKKNRKQKQQTHKLHHTWSQKKAQNNGNDATNDCYKIQKLLLPLFNCVSLFHNIYIKKK